MKVNCDFCSKWTHISEYEFAMRCKGEWFYCEECRKKHNKNISQIKVIKKF